MSLFITQCPYCHTAFRTSISQLQSADGMVRCGACLRVFAADDNLLPSADLRTISRPVIDEEEEDLAPEAHDEQIEIEALRPDNEETSEAELADDSIFTLDLADSLPNRVSPSISEHGSFWEIVDEDTLEPISRVPGTEETKEDLSNIAENDALPEPSSGGSVAAETSAGQHAEALDEDERLPQERQGDDAEEWSLPVDDLLEDDIGKEPEWEPDGVTPDEALDTPPPLAPAATPNEDVAARHRMQALRIDDDMLDERSRTPALSEDDIDHVSGADTPLEFAWDDNARSRRGLLFSSLSLLLLISLGMQWLWFNRDTLSQNPAWRPLMDRVCALAQCSLPPLVEIRSIHSEALEVRSHPEISNALSVQFVFRNDAKFRQPFPGLFLRFTDADEAVVAERRFSPREYLPEGIADMGSMPPGAPVQVSLAILDPGPRAVNYEVSFFPEAP